MEPTPPPRQLGPWLFSEPEEPEDDRSTETKELAYNDLVSEAAPGTCQHSLEREHHQHEDTSRTGAASTAEAIRTVCFPQAPQLTHPECCLLYTSDAADDA